MGRELQKKKNRSSTARVRQKPKSKKLNVRSNAIVAANWDSTLTLSQNYRRLGLTSKLNARTGGIEKYASQVEDSSNASRGLQDRLSVYSKIPTTLTPSEAQIERDPTTGAIIRIIRPQVENVNPLNDPLNEVLDETEYASGNYVSGGVIQELEEQASLEIKKRPRQQSKREEDWVEALVEKYGNDYRGMARDMKLNPYQQTEGDLKRRVKKWKEKGR